MYYVKDVRDGIHVMDTSDGVCECVSEAFVMKLLQHGIKIHGAELVRQNNGYGLSVKKYMPEGSKAAKASLISGVDIKVNKGLVAFLSPTVDGAEVTVSKYGNELAKDSLRSNGKKCVVYLDDKVNVRKGFFGMGSTDFKLNLMGIKDEARLAQVYRGVVGRLVHYDGGVAIGLNDACDVIVDHGNRMRDFLDYAIVAEGIITYRPPSEKTKELFLHFEKVELLKAVKVKKCLKTDIESAKTLNLLKDLRSYYRSGVYAFLTAVLNLRSTRFEFLTSNIVVPNHVFNRYLACIYTDMYDTRLLNAFADFINRCAKEAGV